MPNSITRYHNDFNRVNLSGLSVVKRRALMVIITDAKERGTEPFFIPHESLKARAGIETRDLKRYLSELDELSEDLLSLKIRIYDRDGHFDKFNLFERCKSNDEGVWVQTTYSYSYILNTSPEYLPKGTRPLLAGGYTSFEIDQYASIKKSYSQILFPHLKQYKRSGWWSVKIDAFREIMGIPESYNMADIRKRVLKPAKEELSPYFKNLKIDEVKGKERKARSNAVTELYFSFVKQLESNKWHDNDIKEILDEKYNCPLCGRSLYMILNTQDGGYFYGHADGWKDDARCRQTFGSYEEIIREKVKLGQLDENSDEALNYSKPELSGWSCPKCGEPLFKMYNNKGEMFYGHIDGWKIDAKCRKTYSTVAELRGYRETPTREDHYDLYDRAEVGGEIPDSAAGVYETIANVIGKIEKPKE